ncbi:MAG: hypothetical protein GC154_12590 [bacterium]|nr:hypothetical protein [bacterium]
MKRTILIPWLFLAALSGMAQTYLGVFEEGDEAPFLVTASDPESGNPVTPENMSYSIVFGGAEIAQGGLTELRTGVALGVVSTTGFTAGPYVILVSGQIGGVTAYTHKSFTLAEAGEGLRGIARETAGLNGLTPLTEDVYLPYYAYTISQLSGRIEAATSQLSDEVEPAALHAEISARELSRARLWYAQSAIESASRSVPADMPSHMEIQLASPGDDSFSSPLETFYRIYTYTDALNASKPSSETRSVTPPADGAFYLDPDVDW